MQKSNSRAPKTVVVTLVSVAAGVGLWFLLSPMPQSNAPESGLDAQSESATSTQNTQGNGAQGADGTDSASSPAAGQNDSSVAGQGTEQRIEQGESPGTGEFSRAEFFKPVDWGTNLQALPNKEPQKLNFKPSCKNHPRFTNEGSPAEWAEGFIATDAAQRWPAAGVHVVDWNQFWQAKDIGYQVSIRWNFENPPKYSVVGYSFPINNVDGYGAPAFPEKSEVTWEDAKSFIQSWEKKMIAEGGKAGTRTMTLAEKVFNPADVSPEDIERAEFANGRIRGAQTGKMSCNTLTTDLSSLTCSCWF